jgi:hypothetical protein
MEYIWFFDIHLQASLLLKKVARTSSFEFTLAKVAKARPVASLSYAFSAHFAALREPFYDDIQLKEEKVPVFGLIQLQGPLMDLQDVTSAVPPAQAGVYK